MNINSSTHEDMSLIQSDIVWWYMLDFHNEPHFIPYEVHIPVENIGLLDYSMLSVNFNSAYIESSHDVSWKEVTLNSS